MFKAIVSDINILIVLLLLLIVILIVVSHIRTRQLRDLTMLIPYCNSAAIRSISCADNRCLTYCCCVN